MMDEDDEDYGFEYEGSDNEDDVVDVENEYYTAKSQRDEPEVALASFQKIVDNEAAAGEQGEFGFKALKQMTKLTFRNGQYDRALKHYKTLLTYTKKGVTRNVAEKSINGILDYVSSESKLETGRMQEFYEVTMKALEEAKNDRLSTKTNLKLAKLWLDRKEYSRLNKIVKELHASCAPTDDGGDVDSSQGTLQLEVYALEIQMYGETKNNKKLREIYEKSLRVRSAIPHPRIQGVIRECGGKMFMSEKDWSKAQIDFFESFKSYDEAGSPERIRVLKYLVLAHMLMDSSINPFDSQETKPYKNDREIVAMTNLVSAYQRRDVHEAEKILKDNRATIMDDSFIRGYIDDVLRSLRTQWILEIIKPYTRIEIVYLARQLSIPSEEVEEILVALILDEKIQGRIDQVAQRLELDRHKALEARRYAALDKWTSQLTALQGTMLNKSGTAGAPDRSANVAAMSPLGMGMGSFAGTSGWGAAGSGSEFDRFKVLSVEHFWLSTTPNVPGSKDWDAGQTRMVTLMHFHPWAVSSSKDDFFVLNTHFDDRGIVSRTRASEIILAKISQLAKQEHTTDKLVILVGDLNSPANEDGYQTLTGKRYVRGFADSVYSSTKTTTFRDARHELALARPRTSSPGPPLLHSPFGPRDTFTGFAATDHPSIIDFGLILDNGVFESGWQVTRYGVIPNQFDDGFLASDHRLVVVALERNIVVT